MKEKVILSNDYTDTFLSLAFQEGLLTADMMKSDGVYEKYKKNQIDFALAKSLLEQLLLSPFPVIRKNLLDSVEGSLLEKNQLIIDSRKVDTLVPMSNYPTELFLGILKGNGTEMSETQFHNAIGEIIQLNKEYQELEIEFDGKLPDMGIAYIMRQVAVSSGLVDPFAEDDRHVRLKALNERAEKAIGRLSKVFEFLELQAIAEEQDALVKVRGSFNKIGDNFKSYEDLADTQTLILKITEAEFGYISLRTNSLKETLELAKKPEFIAYRYKIDEWIERLVAGDFDELDKIRKEIKTAKKYIDLIPIVDTYGTALAWVGVPLALFTLPLPLGLGLATAGVIPSMTSSAINKKYKWAMINKVNK